MADEKDRGQEPEPFLMLGTAGSTDGNSLSFQFRGSPGSSNGSPAVTDGQEDGRLVVSKTDKNTWTVHERVEYFHLGSPLTIAQTGLSVPRSLWSLEGGVVYGRRLEKNRSFSVDAGVGSDSDLPFNSIHEMIFRAVANYRLPSGSHNAWLFFLSYSNNRDFLNNIPLPGIAYSIHSPAHRLLALVGFPVAAVSYAPAHRWKARATLLGPRRMAAEIGYRVFGPLQTYAKFDWLQQGWFRAHRDNNSNRLFFDRKRAFVGLRSPLPRGLLLDLAGGREFDRRFFENDSSSHADVPTAEIPPAWFVETKLSFRFGH